MTERTFYFVFLSDFFHGAHRKRIAADSETPVEIGKFHAVHARGIVLVGGAGIVRKAGNQPVALVFRNFFNQLRRKADMQKIARMLVGKAARNLSTAT